MTLGVRVGMIVIRAYQMLIGPFIGGACRFEPSCSAYALEALERHGVVRGLWLSLGRVARCHPLSTPGLDPVPPVRRRRQAQG
jgi:putative membrane protein insertion efficiency factor